MVTHHEEAILGHHNLERDGRDDLLAGSVTVEIGRLIQCLSVHGDPALLVAADDLVAGHTDDPLDEVPGAGVRQYPDELESLANRTAFPDRLISQPATRIGEDDDVAALEVRDLLHDDFVADEQG